MSSDIYTQMPDTQTPKQESPPDNFTLIFDSHYLDPQLVGTSNLVAGELSTLRFKTNVIDADPQDFVDSPATESQKGWAGSATEKITHYKTVLGLLQNQAVTLACLDGNLLDTTTNYPGILYTQTPAITMYENLLQTLRISTIISAVTGVSVTIQSIRQGLQGRDVSRRQFLLGTGLVAGALGATQLIPFTNNKLTYRQKLAIGDQMLEALGDQSRFGGDSYRLVDMRNASMTQNMLAFCRAYDLTSSDINGLFFAGSGHSGIQDQIISMLNDPFSKEVDMQKADREKFIVDSAWQYTQDLQKLISDLPSLDQAQALTIFSLAIRMMGDLEIIGENNLKPNNNSIIQSAKYIFYAKLLEIANQAHTDPGIAKIIYQAVLGNTYIDTQSRSQVFTTYRPHEIATNQSPSQKLNLTGLTPTSFTYANQQLQLAATSQVSREIYVGIGYHNGCTVPIKATVLVQNGNRQIAYTFFDRFGGERTIEIENP